MKQNGLSDLYSPVPQNINLRYFTLGQRWALESICARLRRIEQHEENPDITRSLADIATLLKIMSIPNDF